jgi:NCAIR mutase (PurE)-related protein
MTNDYIRKLLESYKSGQCNEEEIVRELSVLPFEDLSFAKLDHHRSLRTGYPEVIFGEGKTPEQAAAIFRRLVERNSIVLCTRASAEMARAVCEAVPEAQYRADCRVILCRRAAAPPVGLVAVLAAGTSDLGVAEEASIVCEAFGSAVERIYDVGVAGIHRLFRHADRLREARCVVAVAGMEGALPSVVAGLVNVPVIAVPTSVGYGASFGGVAALLAMLNSCAAGVSVVNIDNGFGAAVQADMINKAAVGAGREG